MNVSLEDRYVGCLLGLACGDAVGTTVEFRPRGSFAPLTGMTGGGPFALAAGQWTDDTSMAMCLAESLVERGVSDARDQMQRYVRWWREGYWSATGRCFDIGNATAAALARFERTGDPFAGSTEALTAGNGSLMRLAPAVLFHHPDAAAVDHACAESSRTTHAAAEAIGCCRVFGALLSRALAGVGREALFDAVELDGLPPHARSIATGSWREKSRDQVRGTGFCVESLIAALWCFHATGDFESAVLAAANLGDDADTTAAITGQIAGAFYGAGGIPAEWLRILHRRNDIAALARGLHDQAARR